MVPYVFMQGKPACGLDGLDQLRELPEFKATAKPRQLSVTERIEQLLKGSDVILFMKGTPANPQCGFSSRTVEILKKYDSLEYAHFNIFDDQELREALKKHSNWPTYPQLYVKGKLIGGIDIVQELHEENELEDALMG